MITNKKYLNGVLAALLGNAFLLAPVAAATNASFHAEQVTVASNKPFERTADAIKQLVAKNGMMVMAEVDQGKMLSMTGLTLKATLYLVGNPNVGKQLFEQNHAVGLYVPLRVFVYNDGNGKTFIAYDKPSTLLSQYRNDKIAMVGQMLDQRLHDLVTMAAQ